MRRGVSLLSWAGAVRGSGGGRALCVAALITSAAAQEAALPGKFYRIVDGKVDPRTYNGYRRYHAVCNHCHGPDGMGSSFGPSLVDHLPDIETFRCATAKAAARRS